MTFFGYQRGVLFDALAESFQLIEWMARGLGVMGNISAVDVNCRGVPHFCVLGHN